MPLPVSLYFQKEGLYWMLKIIDHILMIRVTGGIRKKNIRTTISLYRKRPTWNALGAMH